jgi:hypothetical protein
VDLNRRPSWKIIFNVVGLLTLFASWFLGNGGWFLFAGGCLWIMASERLFHFFKNNSVSPYPWMLLSPLLLCQYASVGDFRIRLACFFMLLYVVTTARCRPQQSVPSALANAGPWRWWVLCVATFALVAIALHARGIHLSGDEPHYVMIAQSLAEDGDFDLKNNLEQKTYLPFIPVKIDFHGTIHQGKYHSYHLPGLSFLLLPFYFLFKLLGGAVPGPLYFRLAAAVINSFFTLGLFLVIRSLCPNKNNSALFLFFLATFPLVFHAVHLYPELPAATLLIFAYLCSRPPCRKFFLGGWLLAGIPWLHFKYALPMFILVLWVLAEIWRSRAETKEKIRDLALFLVPMAISTSLLIWYSSALYGSLNPAVISPERNFLAIPLGTQIETLLSFFLDQRDGLWIYAPVFLLLLLAFRKEIRSQIRDFWLLATIFLSYVLLHAFTSVRGAYSPAARPTLFVLWIMAVFLIAYYRQAGEMGKTLFRFLAGLTAFATVWFFYFPLFLYQPVTREVTQRASSMLLFLGSRVVNLSALFPSFLKKPNRGYLPNWIWVFLLVTVAVMYYSRASCTPLKKTFMAAFPYVGMVALTLFCYFPHVQLETHYQIGRLSFFNNSKNFRYGTETKDFQVLAGNDYDLFIDLDNSAAEGLDLRILNPNHVAVKVKNGRQTLLAENQDAQSRCVLSLRSLKQFSLGRRKLAHLGLESKTGPGTVFFWLEFRRYSPPVL